MRIARPLFAALTVSGLLAAQQTWIVDRFNRPGAQFTDLPAAVQAAASGDVLLLRATSSSVADSYEAPTIQGKGITIVGETGSGLDPVLVTGAWDVQLVPAQATVVAAHLVLLGDGFYFPTARPFRITCTSNPGSIVFQNVSVLPVGHWVVPQTFTDCDLVVFSHCTIDMADLTWKFFRSRLMLDDTTMFKTTPAGSTGIWWSGLLYAEDSEVRIAGSTLTGPSAPPGYPGRSDEALTVRGATRVYIASSSRLEGGQYVGGRSAWIEELGGPPNGVAEVYYDPSTAFVSGPLQAGLTLVQTPQCGLRTIRFPATVQIQQRGEAYAPTILLMAPLQATPWNFVIGPVYLDPTNLWSDLALAPGNGQLTRTFAIPPTIPLGQWVGVQAFELTAQNALLASNATVVGIW
jgi:hypothetical protein